MKVCFGISGKPMTLLGLESDEGLKLWFLHSHTQAERVLESVKDNSPKREFVKALRIAELPKESDEEALCVTGNIVDMVMYFLKPIFPGFARGEMVGGTAKPLPDEVVNAKHPENIFVPPTAEDTEPAGLLFNPPRSTITFFFSKEQGREIFEEKIRKEDIDDRNDLFRELENSNLPERASQRPLRLGNPFAYYLFCGYLIHRQKRDRQT